MRFWTRWMAWLNSSDAHVAQWLRAGRDALLGEMTILAGGTALFAVISVVPTLAATVALYGVIADPKQIEAHFEGLEAVLPPQVADFMAAHLARKAAGSHSELGIALAVSVFVAIYASRGAAHAMIDSLNRAYRVRERRSALHKLLVTLAMAGGTLVGILLMLGVVVVLPTVFTVAGLGGYAIVEWLRWPALMSVMFGTLLALYRYAPSPRPLGTVRHLWPGALTATVLVVIVSIGLSIWVDRVARYDLTYGTFGSVVVVLLWFYLSVIAIVVGGFVNAELERHSGAPAPDRSMY
ncbi:MAG TPA: YihY/virulence factor BrkB family protein [Kofleriaceae bacterium]|nr:YihY/virulence factor BrkB family protein [Kofleriaceae bacterium]